MFSGGENGLGKAPLAAGATMSRLCRTRATAAAIGGGRRGAAVHGYRQPGGQQYHIDDEPAAEQRSRIYTQANIHKTQC